MTMNKYKNMINIHKKTNKMKNKIKQKNNQNNYKNKDQMSKHITKVRINNSNKIMNMNNKYK